ncbi:PIR protein, partial [Plasmodium vivax]
PQYVKNGCKYFLYWLYFEVLEKNVDYHKVLKIYEDVVKGYMEESANRHLDKYVSFFSDKTIEKFIKLTEMYDYIYKFKKDTQHDNNKCDHGTKCVHLYKENIKICEESYDYDFCYELDNLKERYDTYMGTKGCCSSLSKTLESYKLHNPAVVIITPFSILLFTPFGSLFRKRAKNNKKIPGNLDYAMNVLPHTSQRVNNHNNNRQYNISYLSSGQ